MPGSFKLTKENRDDTLLSKHEHHELDQFVQKTFEELRSVLSTGDNSAEILTSVMDQLHLTSSKFNNFDIYQKIFSKISTVPEIPLHGQAVKLYVFDRLPSDINKKLTKIGNECKKDRKQKLLLQRTMKRENEFHEGSSVRDKHPRGDTFSEALQQGKFELRLLVSSKTAGAIIGKGGENIKRLRTEFDAQVQVPDSSTPERVCTITADNQTVVKVVRDIIPRLEEFISDDPCELRILIHQSHAGGLIGRGGTKIEELRERCHARLKIYSMCAPASTDRVMVSSGEAENCIQIVEAVMTELKDIPIKGPVNYYSPFNYDPSHSSEYGGYMGGSPSGPPPQRGGAGGPMNVNGPQGPLSGNFNANFDHGDYGSGYINGPPPPPPHGNGIHGLVGFHPEGAYGNSGNYGYGPGAGAGSGSGTVTTAQFAIPSGLGGTISGRERIERIRKDSGAQITLEQATGQPERIITITGTEFQVFTANRLCSHYFPYTQQGREPFGNQ